MPKQKKRGSRSHRAKFDKTLAFLAKISYNKLEAQKAQGRPGSGNFRALHMRLHLIHCGDSRALQPTLYNIFPPL
ncbi:hypothetical protein [Ligaoa zhengdingensis]|uniref:hypothetical protein n=1 Tax=Ligaoa zhengdingensis TaxID=2763658 RepID=UPI0031BA5C93